MKNHRIIGSICFVIAGITGTLLIYVFGFTDLLETGLDWVAVKKTISIFVVSLLLGVLAFQWKKCYTGGKRWLENKCQGIQESEKLKKQEEKRAEKELLARKAEQYKNRHGQEAFVERPLGQIPQSVKLYFNEGAGMGACCLFLLFLVMAVGSVGLIPYLVTVVENIGLLTVFLTIIFWIGFIGAVFSYYSIKEVPLSVFAASSEQILYYVSFEKRQYGDGPRMKFARFLYHCGVMKTEKELREERKNYLESGLFRELLEDVVNGEKGVGLEDDCVITKLNSPQMKGIGITGRKIKYWDEEENCWCVKKLRRTNRGYKEIGEMIKRKRNRIY